MNVLYITHIFPRFYNTFVLNEINQLLDVGVKVLIVSIYRPNELDLSQIEVLGDRSIDVIYLSDSFDYENDDVQLVEGWDVGLFNNRCVMRSLFDLVDEQFSDRYDVIHGAFGNDPATAAYVLSCVTGVPFSFCLHAYDLFVDFSIAGKKLLAAKKIITISDYNKQFLIEKYGVAESRIIVNRVAINFSQCAKFHGLIKKSNTLITVARLHPIKGIEFGIRAVTILKNEFPNVRYLIIGGGELEENLKRIVSDQGLSRHVFFLGELNNAATLRFLSQSGVCILPSLVHDNGDRDGVPTSLLESMFLETPVVASRVSGLPELVDHGRNGFLVEPGDVNELTHYVRHLLTHENLRIAMGKLSGYKVKQMIQPNSTAERLLSAWQ